MNSAREESLSTTPEEVRKQVTRWAEELKPDLLDWRRKIHQQPELGFQERLTSALIVEKLAEFGITELRTGVGETGVIAVLPGGSPGKTVAVRADMDALPIQERAGRCYGSQIAGKMHACGHDAHVAIALGTARVLSQLQGQWPGTVKFLFQPAEEGDPGYGLSGAKRMVAEGAMDNPAPSAIYALHVMPTLDAGQFGCNEGPVWAGADHFTITILGKQTHGAYPHTGLDPIPIAAEVVTSLQTIVSRRVDPCFPTVITVGEIHGGNRDNILAGEVQLKGTVRNLQAGGCAEIRNRIHTLVRGIAGAHGAECRLDFRSYSSVTVNDPFLARRAAGRLGSLAGESNVIKTLPQLGSEDFAEYLSKAPGVYFLLGVRNRSKGIQAMLHTAEFDVDEDVLPLGVQAMCLLTLDQLFLC